MNDRELLELAAKAVGYVTPFRYLEKTNQLLWVSQSGFPATWNPLNDDGDALRLAVKLGIDVVFDDIEVYAFPPDGIGGLLEMVKENKDPYAATRRAIVRAAAAEIGKDMK